MALKIDSKNSEYSNGLFLNTAGETPLTVAEDGVVLNIQNIGQIHGIAAAVVPATITVSGFVGSSFGNGIQALSSIVTTKITVNATGHVSGEVHGILSEATSTIVNKGYIFGDSGNGIQLEAGGKNSITNSGTIKSATAAAIDIIAADSNATFTIINSGLISGDYDGSNSASTKETITNSGNIVGNITTYAGTDTFTNSGTVAFDVDMGSGNDTLKNTGTIDGNIAMGTGDDTFTGGNQNEVLTDEDGADKYSLGGGDDTFLVGDAVSDGKIDTIDGGAGANDIYDARTDDDQVIINLDSKGQTNFMAGSVTVRAANTATGAELGTDSIKNFERALTGDGNDIVFGNSSANYISTGAGNDRLYGFNGNDVLIGSSGVDYYYGGVGSDILNSGNDGDIDRFFYKAANESTKAISGRDQISGFEDGTDIIDLTLMNLADLDFAGMNTNFTPDGQAEARALDLGEKWVIEIDVNGDGKADMAIDVIKNGAMTWSLADFDY